MKYHMIISTAGEICDALDAAIKRLGRDLTKEEVNKVITEMALEHRGAEILQSSDEPFDIDLLAGDLREDGIKVIHPKEQLRRKKRNETGEQS